MARTPKLNDLQLILLSTASAREDGNVFPLAECIVNKPAEVAKAITVLLKRALVSEYPETVLVRVWREDTEQRIGLAITDAGRALIDGPTAPADASSDEPAAIATDPLPTPSRTGTKTDAVLELLSRTEGATSAELIEATGWLPHTTRAALTGLRKKGHAIERTKRGDQTCYRIAGQS
jgi:hypothetical protein